MILLLLTTVQIYFRKPNFRDKCSKIERELLENKFHLPDYFHNALFNSFLSYRVLKELYFFTHLIHVKAKVHQRSVYFEKKQK